MSPIDRALMNASFQPSANAAGADGERVLSAAQPHGQLAAMVDSGTLVAAIVFQNQLPIRRRELIEASIETGEQSLAAFYIIVSSVGAGRRRGSSHRIATASHSFEA